jgi:hypothetical protein
MRIISILFIALLFGCARTHINSLDPSAEIYMDGKYLGVGEVSVDRVGPPRQAHLEAKKAGQIIGNTSMSRNFTLMTIVWGVCSYYTGFYWGWYYPETVTIATQASYSTSVNTTNLWINPSRSIWMQPLSSATPKKSE